MPSWAALGDDEFGGGYLGLRGHSEHCALGATVLLFHHHHHRFLFRRSKCILESFFLFLTVGLMVSTATFGAKRASGFKGCGVDGFSV